MDVSIVAPDKLVWEGDADLVIARSPEGEFGIMRGHIPFLAALIPGTVTVVGGGSRESYFVTGGFLEASGSYDDYHVIVLADDADKTSDIDAEEVRSRLEAARRKSQDDEDEISDAELRAAMARVDLTSG